MLGVTAYVPFANPVNVNTPELFAVAVPVALPLSETVAPLPPVAGLMVPDKLYVCGGGLPVCEFWVLTRPEHPASHSNAAKTFASRTLFLSPFSACTGTVFSAREFVINERSPYHRRGLE